MEAKQTIVIIGGGFGGVACAKELLRDLPEGWELVLVDKNPFHVFQPALYEVATAYLEREPATRFEFQELIDGVTFSFEEIFPQMRSNKSPLRFLQKEVRGIMLAEKKIVFSDGELSFDFLVVALGSEVNYFGIPGLKERALALRDVYDAVQIRNALCEVFSRKQPNQHISIVIGGGGFTGCELAAEMARGLRKLYVQHPHWTDRIAVTIVEASDRLLPGARAWIQDEMKKILERQGVRLLFRQPIRSVKDSFVVLKNGKEVFFDVLLWTAGVKGNSLIERMTNCTVEKGCKVVVDEYLRVIPHAQIFAVGDAIYCCDKKSGQPIPGTAQGAIIQGKHAAKNIIKTIKGEKLLPFSFQWPIFVVPTGGKTALSHFYGIRLRGFLGWLLHQAAFLRYFTSILPFLKALCVWWNNMKMFSKND